MLFAIQMLLDWRWPFENSIGLGESGIFTHTHACAAYASVNRIHWHTRRYDCVRTRGRTLIQRKYRHRIMFFRRRSTNTNALADIWVYGRRDECQRNANKNGPQPMRTVCFLNERECGECGCEFHGGGERYTFILTAWVEK